MNTKQLTITSVIFGAGNTTMVAKVQNTGTFDFVITDAEVSGYGLTGASYSETTMGEAKLEQ